MLSHVWLFATPWTVAYQVPLFLGFLRQEYCSGLPFPSLGNLSNPGIEPASHMSSALACGFFTTCTIWEAQFEAYQLATNQADIQIFHYNTFFFPLKFLGYLWLLLIKFYWSGPFPWSWLKPWGLLLAKCKSMIRNK